MPLPDALTPLLTDRQFWSHYFFERELRRDYFHPNYSFPYPQLEDCCVEIDIASGYGLRLHLTRIMASFGLDLMHPNVDATARFRLGPGVSSPSEIGWDDEAHWHPHCLRWEELDLLARCVALQDATLPHPGALVALLMRFAPICKGDNLDVIMPVLEEGWRTLGFAAATVVERIENIDMREAEFFWTEDAARGWTIAQTEQGEDHGQVYSLRSVTNDEFPWQPMAEMLALAERTYAESRNPHWETWHSGTIANLASQMAELGDLQQASVLADALEDCSDCPESVLQSLRQSDCPVRAWIAVEWITGVQRGSLIERWVGPTTYIVPATATPQ